MRWLLSALIIVSAVKDAHGEDKPTVGVVVLIDQPVAKEPLLAQTKRLAKGRWRAVTLKRRVTAVSANKSQAVTKLETAYFEADFLRCMTLLQRGSLNVNRLLQRGDREVASRAAVLAAACAHGSRDQDLTIRLLRRVHVQGLGSPAAFKGMRPDFRSLADAVEANVKKAGRVVLTVTLQPRDARLSIDGGQTRCDSSPCRVALLAGEHWFDVRRFGHAPRAFRRSVRKKETIQVSLDPASASQAKRQLASALVDRVDPGSVAFAATSAIAYQSPVVLLVWQKNERRLAAVYDRRVKRVVSRVSVVGTKRAALDAAHAAIVEWRGVRSVPLYKKPLFWTAIAGAAAAIGVVTYILLRPSTTPSYEIVFR
jgi:hypothetical protein